MRCGVSISSMLPVGPVQRRRHQKKPPVGHGYRGRSAEVSKAVLSEGERYTALAGSRFSFLSVLLLSPRARYLQQLADRSDQCCRRPYAAPSASKRKRPLSAAASSRRSYEKSGPSRTCPGVAQFFPPCAMRQRRCEGLDQITFCVLLLSAKVLSAHANSSAAVSLIP